ncbi:MAG TPA: twin-arginine translocase TatA/TatE family subunit [Chitinophagaceae bacterium]|nr:twin-arginine translocase TatA/TatE family subunit [Chitinophagaceae bacterium]
MGNLGFQEILLIAVVVLVLFGGRKIPEFMRGLGRGVREFNDAKDNVKKELEDGMKEKDVKPTTPAATSSNDYDQYLEWKKQQEMTATKEPVK